MRDGPREPDEPVGDWRSRLLHAFSCLVFGFSCSKLFPHQDGESDLALRCILLIPTERELLGNSLNSHYLSRLVGV